MKYICLLIFISCNYSNHDKVINNKQVVHSSFVDSFSKTVDSIKIALADFKEVSDFAKEAQARILMLESKKKAIEVQIGEQPTYMAVQPEDYKPSDDKDKEINRLRQQVRDYEREIAKLKNRLFYDSMNHISKNYDIVPENKPDDKSLIITLDKKLKGDGDISEQGVSVYIMKYTKEAKKLFKEYGNCQTKDLNLLQAKEANYYNGQYFFNDISPGKYLIKVCALFGNWMVINKTDYKQEIKMLMSPPIQ
jgi:hypothetical protein